MIIIKSIFLFIPNIGGNMLDDFFSKKNILITGGTGSLGTALLDTFLSLEKPPNKIVIFSRDEAKQHSLRLKYLNKNNATDEVIYGNFKRTVEFRIGDVKSFTAVSEAIKDIDIVIHTAALKQVPTCEYFPDEAINNNILGSYNIALATKNSKNVKCVLGISTDKACKPINAYGSCKSLMEKIFISSNINSPLTKFVLVRYGNVLNSRGSIIPLLKEQIDSGSPITLTHPDMTRFFISMEKAIQTIFKAIKYANPGEIYVPILNSFKIVDLINVMIKKSNKNPKIVTIGLRPGEKINEELVSEEEAIRTYISEDHYIIEPLLPELKITNTKEKSYLNKPYNSKDYVLPFEEVEKILLPYIQ